MVLVVLCMCEYLCGNETWYNIRYDKAEKVEISVADVDIGGDFCASGVCDL